MAIAAIVFDAYGTLFDVGSVAEPVAQAFPRHADFITRVWRIKQLEYSWLCTMMNRYEDFRTITRQSLSYTIGLLGLPVDPATLDRLTDAYDGLTPYPDTTAALDALAGERLAILSNGSPQMLAALLDHSDIATRFEAVLSVDAARAYKPDPRAYALVPQRLGVSPQQILFVTSNGFDVAGASSFGFRVARIERVNPACLHAELAGAQPGPASLFKALRSQAESLGAPADSILQSLLDLPPLLDRA